MNKGYSRFSKFFCGKIEGKHVCYEVDDGLYISDSRGVMYAENLDRLDEFFYCDMDNNKHRIFACVWKHPRTGKTEKVIKSLKDTELVETKRIDVAGKKKPVPVVKVGSVYVDLEDFEKALRTFLGDPVEIIYPESKKQKDVEPVLIKDKKTGEAVLLTPYFIAQKR